METTVLSILREVVEPANLLFILFGLVGGMVIGALPGLTANMGVALLLPVTFGMDPIASLSMLIAVYCAAIYAGSIPAVLINTPGTSASAATALDGYALTKQGKAHVALRISLWSSVVGGLISGVFLLVLTPPLSLISLKFGPPEYFLLAIFGLTTIASVASGTLIKGLLAGALGLLLGTVGVDATSGFPRFTFGVIDLQSGISFVPAVIGLFSLSEALMLTRRPDTQAATGEFSAKGWELFPTRDEIRSLRGTVLCSSLIGLFVGILPGAGADIGSWVSYSEAKRFSKNPEMFGKGSLEGVAASETANNAETGGALIPMLTLGIPGSATSAVLMGGLLIHGLVPGRELFTVHAHITYTLMVAFLVANALMGLVGILFIRYSPFVCKVPNRVLAPVVVLLCVVGSYSLGNNIFDVWVMIAFGLLGYFMRLYNYHPAALVLGLILGPMAERGFRQSLVLARGDLLGYFLGRPLSVILAILILAVVFGPAIGNLRRARQQRAQGLAGSR